METKPELAQRLTKAREIAGCKDAKAACDRFGWTYHTYIQHERGERGFSAKTAERYARAYKVRVEWLYLGLGTPDGSRHEVYALIDQLTEEAKDWLAGLLKTQSHARQ